MPRAKIWENKGKKKWKRRRLGKEKRFLLRAVWRHWYFAPTAFSCSIFWRHRPTRRPFPCFPLQLRSELGSWLGPSWPEWRPGELWGQEQQAAPGSCVGGEGHSQRPFRRLQHPPSPACGLPSGEEASLANLGWKVLVYEQLFKKKTFSSLRFS